MVIFSIAAVTVSLQVLSLSPGPPEAPCGTQQRRLRHACDVLYITQLLTTCQSRPDAKLRS